MEPTRRIDEAATVHRDAIVMDMTCPLMNYPKYWQYWIEGGTTVAAPTVANNHNAAEALSRISKWFAWLERFEDKILHVTKVEDIFKAKEEGKLGIVFHFQNSAPIEQDAGLVEVFSRLGLVFMQLAYNTKNFVGNGCEEKTDDGLSAFGRRVIREMNRCKVIVDGSHTGKRTFLDALEISERPVVVSHANCRGVCDNQRNLDDETIRAVAEQGGVIGLVGFPTFIRRGTEQPTLDQLVDHVDYICQLVGNADVSSLAIDYYEGTEGIDPPDVTEARYHELISEGTWNADNYEAPPHRFPRDLEDPRGYPNFTAKLLERGYGESDVKKILGENWIRVLRANGR